MGTRNLICIYYKGSFIVAQYCQWDGYPEGQGRDILRFLLIPGNIERLKAGLSYITIVDSKTVEKLTEGHGYITFRFDGGHARRVCECGAPSLDNGPSQCCPPTLSRDTGSKVFDIIASARSDDYMPILLSLDFANDSLFCEYCYCVDLDAEVFEIFGGHVQNIKKSENAGDDINMHTGQYRFADVNPNAKAIPRLLKSYPLAELPKNLEQFLKEIAAGADESMYETTEEGDDEQKDDAEDTVKEDTVKEDDVKEDAVKEDAVKEDAENKDNEKTDIDKEDSEKQDATKEEIKQPTDQKKDESDLEADK